MRPAAHRTLARSYHEDAQLDAPDQEKLQMLETYLSSARPADGELRSVADTPMPTRAEDVDKFMAELAAAAGGGELPKSSDGEPRDAAV